MKIWLVLTGIDDWKTLIGEWKARSSQENEFGEEGYVDSVHKFKMDLGDGFITGRERSYQGDKEIHTMLSVLWYDGEEDLFRRKSFFSYGFVNNEVEYYRDENTLRFEITMEPITPFFKGTKWRSYITKVDDDTLIEGLESSKDGGEYTLLGETVMKRVK